LKLEVVFQASSFEDAWEQVEIHFNQKMRLIKEEHSIFEQWQVRPAGSIFIPKVWSYRLVCKDGVFHFGTIL
jgi:hypothetical protein